MIGEVNEPNVGQDNRYYIIQQIVLGQLPPLGVVGYRVGL